MIVKLKLTELKKAFKNIQKAIPSNPQLPILSSVLINIKKNKAELSATDLYLGIKTHIYAESEQDLLLVLPGFMFRDLVNSFNQDEVVIKTNQENTEIICGKSIVKLPVQDPKEYPEFPKINGWKIEIPAELLKEIFTMINYAASLDQVRPILTTIMFEFSEKGLEVAATDGFRLAVIKYPEIKSDSKKILIPIKSFEEMCQIMEQSKAEKVVWQIDEELKQIKIKIDQNDIFIRLIEGDYPPYKKIIPESFETQIGIDGENLKEELQRAFIMAREASNIVRFELKKDHLKIRSISPSFGEYGGEVQTNKTSDNFKDKEIAFDIRYLLDFLNNTNPKELDFYMNESLKPALFSLKDWKNFIYVVMPFRVND